MKKILTVIIVVIALQLTVASIASASGGTYHRVRYGETLYSIGRSYGVSPYRIADANNLRNPNYIYAGQVLLIPSSGGDCGWGCDGPGQGQYHKVRYGETLFSIGRQYGVNPYSIARANNLYNPNYIYAGQVLYIPSGGYGYNPGYDGCGRGCDRGWNDCGGGCNDNWSGCGSGCQNWGYDYTGYYYTDGQDRYSYTCGYYFNCW
jgi:LysM repeat protein